MSKSPKVSIIVPAYNVERLLADCIDSILSQTHKNIETIIINDGSTDNTLDIASEFAREHPNIIVINQTNGGVSSARNAGLRAASGQYVAFVDADDAIHKTYIENLLLDADSVNADIVSTPQHLRNSSERQEFLDKELSIEPACIAHESKNALIALYNGTLEKGNNGCQMFKTRLLIDNSISFDTNMAIGEDFDFLARAVIHARVVAVDNRELYFYRANPQSAVHKEFNIDQYRAIANMQRAGRLLQNPSRQLLNAMDNNLFVASASYGALMYHKRHEFADEFDIIKSNIKKLRLKTLVSNGVNLNGRIRAILLMSLGVHLGLIIIRKLIRI